MDAGAGVLSILHRPIIADMVGKLRDGLFLRGTAIDTGEGPDTGCLAGRLSGYFAVIHIVGLRDGFSAIFTNTAVAFLCHSPF